MKLKLFLKGLFTLGLTTLLISFTSATRSPHSIGAYFGSEYQVSVLQNGNLDTIYGDISKSVFSPTGNPIFYWDSDGNANLIAPAFYSCQNQSQFVYYYICDEIPDSNFTNFSNCTKTEIDNSYLSSFLGSVSSSDNWAFELVDSVNTYYSFNICFSSKEKGHSLCYFYTANQGQNMWCYQGGDMTGDRLNYNFSSIPDDIIGYSPGYSSTPKPNVNVGICPTVKTLLSTSNLTPAVCYAGYDADLIYEAGENTPIEFGSGITIFETYDLFSGNMTIQNWYDTYWNYYQNISWNGYPFYGKPKALLGIETARQIAGTSAGYKGSYVILNYCWYLLGNFDENASTCVLPNLESVYSGITITNQDKQDLIDDLNDDYDIRRPGSGSIYDGVWSGNGGGSHSWGDECNSIPCMFNRFYDMFNTSVVDDVDFTSSGGGILPSYIGLAFVVVVLFYIFKR